MSEFLLNVPLNASNKKINNGQKVYIYVPYDYKDDAKKHGAKWDNNNNKWFCFSDNIYLIDLYDESNFTDSYYGTKMKKNTTTKTMREKEYHFIKAEYKRMKKEWKLSGNDPDGFAIWYSVNVSGHE